MSRKAKQQQLDEARERVMQLESELRMLDEQRIGQLADLLDIVSNPSMEDVYEKRAELYDLFDRWFREDKI